jgi:hypothetical protein
VSGRTNPHRPWALRAWTQPTLRQHGCCLVSSTKGVRLPALTRACFVWCEALLSRIIFFGSLKDWSSGEGVCV